MKGKALYTAAVKVRNIRALQDVREHQWQDALRGQTMAKFRWRVLDKPPITKRSGDLHWRVRHGALATNFFLSKID